MSIPAKGKATLDDLARLRDAGRAVELIAGEIVEKAMPSPVHGRSQARVSGAVLAFDRRSGGPHVFIRCLASRYRPLPKESGLSVRMAPGRLGSTRAGMKRYRIARAAIHPRPGVVLALAAALFACAVAAPWFGGATGVALFAVGVATFIALLVYVHLAAGRLDVGADGLLVDLRDTRRYVAFAQLSDAAPYAEKQMGKRFVGVLLRLASGEQVKVPLGEDLIATERRVVELAQVVRAALAAYRDRDRADVSTALARGSLSTDQWLRRLRAIGALESPGGHREGAVPREGLWRVVEDFSAEASLRAGAAVALAAALDGEERLRLRATADVTASPRLRVALEAAASGDETRAVAAFEEEEEKTETASRRRAGRGG